VFAISSALADVQLLTNGNIYTGNAAAPWAEAVVIEDGIFSFVGDTTGAQQFAGEQATRVDLEGRTVIPGLYESHVHPQGGDELDVVTNFSPMFWYPSALADGMLDLLGAERMSDYCPAVELRETGSFPNAGSDWPVMPDLNPWNGIEAFVTRANPFDEHPDETLASAEAVTLEQALKLYTINGARILGIDDRAGSIEVGKSTDLVGLNHDIFSIPVEQLSETQTLQVYFASQPQLNR
jgi:predicted amidohydrolase YtcJ